MLSKSITNNLFLCQNTHIIMISIIYDDRKNYSATLYMYVLSYVKAKNLFLTRLSKPNTLPWRHSSWSLPTLLLLWLRFLTTPLVFLLARLESLLFHKLRAIQTEFRLRQFRFWKVSHKDRPIAWVMIAQEPPYYYKLCAESKLYNNFEEEGRNLLKFFIMNPLVLSNKRGKVQ